MRFLLLIVSMFFISGCAKKEMLILKASPESAVQMADEAERMRAELNRHLKKEDVSQVADAIYLKAMHNEIHE